MSTPTLQFEAPPLRIDDLCRRIRAYLTPDQIKDVRRAYRFGADAHEGQTRKSGEPYIQHPLAVAGILADMHMDHETLIAAMLHDVIEDSLVPKEEIAGQFGGDGALVPYAVVGKGRRGDGVPPFDWRMAD